MRTIGLALAWWTAVVAPEGWRVTKLGESVVDPAALTIKGDFGRCINGMSFQQDAVRSLAGWQYLGWYNAARRVCLSRRKLPDGPWQHLEFGDYDFRSNDAHNVISIGLCAADGTIHLAWDHHGGALHYRVSRPGVATDPPAEWTAALFGPVTSELEPGVRVPSVTYPRFIAAPAGGLQLCYRRGGSGNGDRLLVDWDPAAGHWRGTRPIDNRAGTYTEGDLTSASRCSYPNGYTYDAAGRLHVTWVWREDAAGANHDLCYTYSDDRGYTWRNSAGEVIGETGPGKTPPSLDSPGLAVVRIPLALGMMNTHGQAIDSAGRIHAVVWHASPEAVAQLPPEQRRFRWAPPAVRRYYHYFRDTDGTWRQRELPGPADRRPKLLFDRRDNAVLITTVGRDLLILGATAAAAWNDWRLLHTEPGPFEGEALADHARWAEEGILSVMLQASPDQDHAPSALRVYDYRLTP